MGSVVGDVFGKNNKAPAAPDYVGAANAQGAANVETARTQGRINNPTYITPYGSQTVLWGQPTNYNDPTLLGSLNGTNKVGFGTNVYSIPQSLGDIGLDAYRSGSIANMPGVTSEPSQSGDSPTVIQSLTPIGQQRFNQQQRIFENLGNVAESGLSRVGAQMATPFDWNAVPQFRTGAQQQDYVNSINTSPVQSAYDAGGQIQRSSGYSQPLQSSVDTSALSHLSQGVNAGSLQNSASYGQIQGGVDTNPLSHFQTTASGGGIQGSIDANPLSRLSQNVNSGPLQYSTAYNTPLQSTYDAGGQVQRSANYNTPIQGQVGNAGQIQSQIADVGGQQRLLGNAGSIQGQIADVGGNQRNLDFSAAPNLPRSSFTGENDPVTQAIIQRNQPFMNQRRMQLETQLTNQGLRPGMEAWDNAFKEFDNQQNDFLLGAIQTGAQQQQALFNQGITARQQAVGEAAQQGQFQNAAQQQAFQQAALQGQFGNEAQQQAYGQLLSSGQFANQAQQQEFQQAAMRGEFGNEAQQQAYGQLLSSGNFANQAQQQGYGQAIGNANLANTAQAQANAQNLAAAQLANIAQGQGYNQALSNANLQNAAQGQAFQQGQANAALQNQALQAQFQGNLSTGNFANAAQQQAYAQSLGNANLKNTALQNQFQGGLSAGQFSNEAQQQGFNQSLANANLYNAAQGQSFDQASRNAALKNQALQSQFQGGVTAGQFANQAQQQGFEQALANQNAYNQAQAQANAQNANAAQFANQAQGQQFSQGQANAQLANQAAQQRFYEALQNAQFGNQARQQSIQEQQFARSLPLNELNSLMSSSPIGIPQFQQYQSSNIAPPPLFAANQAQGQWNQNLYNQQVGQNNAMTSGLFGLGAAGIGAYGMMNAAPIIAASDRRLKSDIVRVGTHRTGIGVYDYTIFGRRQRGVMADEVAQVMPEAVLEHPAGFLMVNYGMLQ